MSPHLSSRLDLSQSDSSSYATRHWEGPISPLILCIRLSYDCIPCSIYINFFEHGWVVKTRFLYYISCHSICDIRWMIWSFLITTNTWALMILWMTTTHISIWSYTYWSKPTSNGEFASGLNVRDGESCSTAVSHWEGKLGSRKQGLRSSAWKLSWGVATIVG